MVNYSYVVLSDDLMHAGNLNVFCYYLDIFKIRTITLAIVPALDDITLVRGRHITICYLGQDGESEELLMRKTAHWVTTK